MRTREIAPLKPPEADIDLHRFTTTNHHYETPINRKFLSHLHLFFSLSSMFFFVFWFNLFFVVLYFFIPELIHFFFFVYFPYDTPGQHQHQPLYLNKRMVLPAKRQTPAGSVVKKNCEFSFFFFFFLFLLTSHHHTTNWVQTCFTFY